MSVEGLRQELTAFLTAKGIQTMAAWPEEKRTEVNCPVAVVSLRECRGEKAGFRDYLGERFNPDTGLWEECYGRKVTLVFGLDLYAPARGNGAELEAAFGQLLEALTGDSPQGMQVGEVVCEETRYDQSARLQMKRVRVVCHSYLCAVERPGEGFVDFELRGGMES